jgi:hypothetical protein
MMRTFFVTLSILTLTVFLPAQEILFDRNGQTLSTIERFSVKTGIQPAFHQSLKKLDRIELIHYLQEIGQQDSNMHPMDREDLELALSEQYFPGMWPENQVIPMQTRHFRNEENKWFRHFYRTKPDLFATQKNDLYLKVNPVVRFAFGRDQGNQHTTFQNTRGLILEGGIGQNLYFYSSIYENQGSFPAYIDQKIQEEKAIPGNGFFKSFGSTVFPGVRGYDYANSQAYLSARIHKNISTQFGHGRYFIGHGIRSLLLSDLSQNYFFLAFNTNIWKFHYHNLFAELASTSPEATPGDVLNPKKYMASHYLSYRIAPNLEAGLFESVIFSRQQHFELQYLNPVILYRSVEQFLGSPDNVLMGLDINYSFLKRYKVYGQLILDEFSLRHILENDGWWGNKYGLQAGIKAFDLGGISHLDLQLEGNFVRPFTYSHQDSSTNYTHYRQLLAHPLGSSFYEGILRIKYRPVSRIYIEGTALYANQGGDLDGENRGSNVFRSSNDRVSETAYFTADGDSKNYWIIRLKLQYRLYPGYFAEIHSLYRHKEILVNSAIEKTLFAELAFKVNFHQTDTDY